ncbi:hypothetical protein PanWU01x14_327480, partial [Parasponia andersonii]
VCFRNPGVTLRGSWLLMVLRVTLDQFRRRLENMVLMFRLQMLLLWQFLVVRTAKPN